MCIGNLSPELSALIVGYLEEIDVYVLKFCYRDFHKVIRIAQAMNKYPSSYSGFNHRNLDLIRRIFRMQKVETLLRVLMISGNLKALRSLSDSEEQILRKKAVEFAQFALKCGFVDILKFMFRDPLRAKLQDKSQHTSYVNNRPIIMQAQWIQWAGQQ